MKLHEVVKIGNKCGQCTFITQYISSFRHLREKLHYFKYYFFNKRWIKKLKISSLIFYYSFPGVVHVPKLATPVALPNNTVKAQQMKILVAPPPPTLNEKGQPKDAKASDDVVDMEIENQIEETVIENVPTGKDDTTKPPPIPNTSRPPPGYPKKSEPTPTPFTPAGPPPPFVTNSFMQVSDVEGVEKLVKHRSCLSKFKVVRVPVWRL